MESYKEPEMNIMLFEQVDVTALVDGNGSVDKVQGGSDPW